MHKDETLNICCSEKNTQHKECLIRISGVVNETAQQHITATSVDPHPEFAMTLCSFLTDVIKLKKKSPQFKNLWQNVNLRPLVEILR